LLLGLRGMLSEAELHLLQLRLAAGRERQIERGSYRHHLPTGLVRLPDGRVIKDPNERIQRTVALVFTQFRALGSCQKVLRRFRDDGLLLPRAQTAGPFAGQLLWKQPTAAALYAILRNPAYAGAFAYGRRGPSRADQPGRTPRRLHCAPEAWATLHHDVYPAYISWDEFMADQARLTDNASRHAWRTRGAPRQGAALLAGLAVCGRCGHQLRVGYKTHHRYLCNALSETHGAPMCLSLDGPSIDAVVVEAFFAALAPAELDLLDAVLAAERADRERLAERQYHAVDPDNRLVAAELERRWELALRALAEAREAADRFARRPAAPAVDPLLRAQLRDVGAHLPALWASGRLTPAQQKELLRSLIRRVILSRPAPDLVEAKVIWVSGASSVVSVRPPVHRGRQLQDYEQLVARVLALSAEGYQDAVIAERLTAEGFRSARRSEVPRQLVEQVRRAHGVVSLTEQFRRRDQIDGAWTVGGLARAVGVRGDWPRKQIAKGTITAERHAATGRYLIADEPELLERLGARTPNGWHS
jgi:hypothetical protein